MKKRALLLVAPVLALILELLPYGAVLNFATPEETFRRTYSYFDLTPYGYANFGPFLTALLTCLLLAVLLLYVFTGKGRGATKILAPLAAVMSLMWLLYGFAYFSMIGGLISLTLLIEAVLVFRIKE